MPKENASVGTTIVFLILALLLIGFVFYRQSYIEQGQEQSKEQQVQIDKIEEDIESLTKQLTPYKRKDKMLKALVIDNFANSSANNKPTAVFNNPISVSGTIKNGLIYVRASVNERALTKNDDIYVKISGQIQGQYVELGGHLIEGKSIDVPKSSDFTEVLFDLTDVKYKESFNDPDYEVSAGDWLKLLNGGNSQIILSFVSTERNGLIEDLSFYYDCETVDCSIK